MHSAETRISTQKWAVRRKWHAVIAQSAPISTTNTARTIQLTNIDDWPYQSMHNFLPVVRFEFCHCIGPGLIVFAPKTWAQPSKRHTQNKSHCSAATREQCHQGTRDEQNGISVFVSSQEMQHDPHNIYGIGNQWNERARFLYLVIVNISSIKPIIITNRVAEWIGKWAAVARVGSE